MSKSWWETFPEVNEQGQAQYIKDCVITISAITKAAGPYSQYGYAFANISVLDQSGSNSVNMSMSLNNKDNMVLTQEHLNKPFPCEIKVVNDNTKYAVQGRKYTIRFPKGAQSGGQPQQQQQQQQPAQGNQAPAASYQNTGRDFTAEARGKVSHGVICAAIQSKQLPCTSEAEVSAWVDLIMAYGESQKQV